MKRQGGNPKIPAPPGFYGCPACGVIKPVSEFFRCARGPDGHGSHCKPCKAAMKIAMRERKRNQPDATIEARFWPKVDKNGPNGCWNWLGAKSNRGYGAIFYKGHDSPAHRVSMELAGHTINYAEQVVDHVCKNIACVNPAHLRICTQVENTTIYADRTKQKAKWLESRERRKRDRENRA